MKAAIFALAMVFMLMGNVSATQYTTSHIVETWDAEYTVDENGLYTVVAYYKNMTKEPTMFIARDMADSRYHIWFGRMENTSDQDAELKGDIAIDGNVIATYTIEKTVEKGTVIYRLLKGNIANKNLFQLMRHGNDISLIVKEGAETAVYQVPLYQFGSALKILQSEDFNDSVVMSSVQ